MHDYEIKVLSALKDGKAMVLEDLLEKTGLQRDSATWALENLSVAKAVDITRERIATFSLTKEGTGYLEEFPEETVVKKMKKSNGKERAANLAQIGFSWALKNNWVSLEKGIAVLTDAGSAIATGKAMYEPREVLNELKAGKKSNEKVAQVLLKRGLVEMKERSGIKSIRITDAGAKILATASKEKGIGALSKEIIASGAWEKEGFRPYNIGAPSETTYPARLHPLRELINAIRQKWFEMGFIEVSGPIVETAFWNFDALFSPQDHPTREMQDTFFLSNPEELTIEDIETLQKVRKMHIKGWKEQWNEEIASEAVLRTHTTSVSAHYMRKLALTLNANYPLKLFSVGSVFRNENLDYKHLAELHQTDGIIVGDNLTLSNLIDTLKKFYSKLGIDNVQIRPSYFPFTEPSLEAFYYDEEHGDFIELCGGGIIRKEITKAMGSDKTVLAWGMGIDRMLLNSKILGIDSIVTPYKNNIGWLRLRPNLKV